MLSNRPPITSLMAGLLLGTAGVIKLNPDSVMAIIIAASCALLCMTRTSEKKVFIFLAGGFAVALIDFVLLTNASLVETLAYIAAISLTTFYLTDTLSK